MSAHVAYSMTYGGQPMYRSDHRPTTGMVLKELFLLSWLLVVALAGGGGYSAGGYRGGNAVGPYLGGAPGGGGCAGAACAAAAVGPDFNPVLLQGIRGYPGIRARLNPRTFQYASGLIAELLNQEIKRARIPPITSPVPGGIEGCIMIYNLYVSRYRCPQRVVLYPAPPNRLILQVDNVDVGITGNLGGQIVILLPIALFGILQINLHQMSILVDLAVERGPHGPYVRMLSCNIQIGYADACIQNGGLIGDIINSQFRERISNQVREMVPNQICNMLPSIINEKLNSRLSQLPQSVAVTQMLSMFSGALSAPPAGPSAQYCQQYCQGKSALRIPSTPTSAASSANSAVSQVSQGPGQAPQIPQGAYNARPQARGLQQRIYNTNQAMTLKQIPRRNAIHAAPTAAQQRTVTYLVGDARGGVRHTVIRNKRQAPVVRPAPNGAAQIVRSGRGVGGYQPAAVAQFAGTRYGRGTAVGGYRPGTGPAPPPPPPVPGAPPAMLVPPSPDLCAKCPPASGASDDPMSFIRLLAAGLDMRKLSDLYLTIQLLGVHATSNDFTIDLTGEFSPNAQGGTPFGAFPVQFPYVTDPHMAEFIVSDYTINSLFYWLHRKQFLVFRIGPNTPKIGELLKTTCNEDEDDESLEATELDEEGSSDRRIRRLSKKTLRTWRNRRASAAMMMITGRGKRQDASSLADLGICFGDILPAVREKYPNQKIAIVIRTIRAPSLLFSAARGGMVTLDLLADADIYIDGTNNKVGTITIASTIVLVVQLHGNRLTGTAEISSLKLTDRSGTLGLPQDALDNLGNLGKELIQKLLNDTLQKGIVINIPLSGIGGLPINVVNPQVRIIEHGLHIATDLTISPSLLGIEGSQC
nr:Lipid-binding serum glycoprotein domain containing protein [Haemonchus contortus]